jgi:hypothetical protein
MRNQYLLRASRKSKIEIFFALCAKLKSQKKFSTFLKAGNNSKFHLQTLKCPDVPENSSDFDDPDCVLIALT